MDQNPTIRRAYVVTARQELLQHLQMLGEIEFAEMCEEPRVVMTEALPYEGKIEGYRALIFEKCKEAFLADLFENDRLADTEQRAALLGEHHSLSALFDRWWIAREVDTIEVNTTW